MDEETWYSPDYPDHLWGDFGDDPDYPHGYSASIIPEQAGPYAGALLESGFRENPAPWYDTFKVKKGALTRFGYHVDESVEKRRRALAKSVAADSYNTTLKRVVLLRTWNKRRPSIYKPVNADVKWLQKNRARLEGKIIEMPTRERRRIAANPRRRKRAR